ncbi:MAG: hypothetical protein IT555_00055 [Acetobacteraceae bacterium]|nr:hypothetical protein [Acetobacteraceae bacterium]
MSHGLANTDLTPAEAAAPRGFGEHPPADGERWPVQRATVTILALSLAAWLALIQGGRALLALAG